MTIAPKKIVLIFSVACLLVISCELFLRYYLGFCDTVLLRDDINFEYIPVANQDRFRFRNRIIYNRYSMRSDSLDQSAIKILGFGDSFINGGVLTDHKSLATTLLSKNLTKLANKKIQFLNISAGSWGPDNCYAYLKKNGNFNAKMIVLFVSSHDAYDNMDFKKIVGVEENFPNKQYRFAIAELFNKYLIPKLLPKKKLSSKELGNQLGIKKDGSVFNNGFSCFEEYSNQTHIPLMIWLHAEKEEMKKNRYNMDGMKIILFAKNNCIPLVKDIKLLEESDYRDNIHINSLGQRKIGQMLLKEIEKLNIIWQL